MDELVGDDRCMMELVKNREDLEEVEVVVGVQGDEWENSSSDLVGRVVDPEDESWQHTATSTN